VTERDESERAPRTPARRRDPKDKAERLVHAALEAMDEFGYTHTTIHEICRRAGVSVGTFYAQFDSKAELLSSAASPDQALAFASDELRDPRRIQATLKEFLGGPRGSFWRAWREAVLSEPSLAPREEELAHEVRARLTEAIRDARKGTGVSDSVEDAAGVAWLIFGLVREALRQGAERPKDVAPLMAHAIWLVVTEAKPQPAAAQRSTHR
jgi:AcrR family transcriptional regulator